MTVAIVMGSSSDLSTMQPAIDTLIHFGVEHEVRVVSAHRTPFDMIEFGRSAVERGVAVIIAGAGGAAHLPGMLASTTRLPVIGVPVPIGALQGMDALLSVVQMPRGIPVATVAIGGAENAALLAIRILGLADPRLAAALDQHRTDLEQSARAMDTEVRNQDG
jgi:5-(carboxyamino)imidazole ribonucleotide mutase